MPIPLISPKQFQQLYDSGMRENGSPPVLIDVRTPIEFREVHAEQARNVPLDSLDPAALKKELNNQTSQTVYFICRSGNRAQTACQQMIAAGFEDVCCVDGGTLEWDSVGLPVKRGRAAMSLERQVRITAGALVAIGGALAVLVNPLWGLLPAAVGSGLVFAGITDTCGMGMVLAKMPWNRPPEASRASPTSCCVRKV